MHHSPECPRSGASPAERVAMLNMLMHFLATQQWPRLINCSAPA
jgi:hypothetical protein